MNIQDRIYYDQGWNDRLDDKPLLVFQCSREYYDGWMDAARALQNGEKVEKYRGEA